MKSDPLTANVAPGVSFVVRPFPPPNLVGVPIEYVVTQLRKLAPHYWSRNDSADCTIIIPMGVENRYRAKRPDITLPRSAKQIAATFDPITSGPFAPRFDDSPSGRRRSAPVIGEGLKKRLVVRLHRDYLSSQSTFLRALFSGSSPLDLANPVTARPTSKLAAGAFPVPPSAQPRLLPCALNHPQLLLPLPDPSSFPHIVHYLYFGHISFIEECLTNASITWEGIVRNVEYLGLRDDIKIFLGRWWGNWLDPTRHRRGSLQYRPAVIEEDSEGEQAEDESEQSLNRSPSPRTKARTKRRSQELQYPPSTP